MMLVDSSGFCFPRIVGIREKMKIQPPIVKTRSCHCILKEYHFLAIFARVGIDSDGKNNGELMISKRLS